MEIKVYTINLEPPRWLRFALIYCVLPVGLLAGGSFAARAAGILTKFERHTLIKADEVNANFDYLQTQITQLQSKAPHAAEADHAQSATTAATANAAGGALKATIDRLTSPSGVFVQGLTTFDALTNTPTKVPYKDVSSDDLDEWKDDHFSAAAAGDYLLCASLAAGAGTVFQLTTYRNNMRDKFLAITGGTFNAASACTVARLDKGDTLDVRISADAPGMTGITSTSANSYLSWLTIVKVR